MEIYFHLVLLIYVMKTLIVHYSHTGNNALLARKLSDLIDNSKVLEVNTTGKRKEFSIFLDLLFNRNPAVNYEPIDWSAYEMVIICAPVWNYKVAHPMRSFLRKERSGIPEYVFLSICSGREEQQQKLEKQLKDVLGKDPLFVHQLLLSSFMENKSMQTLDHPELTEERIENHKDLLESVVHRLKREGPM